MPIGAPDYAIYANSVLKDSDGILISMNADQAARFIVAMRQTGTDKPMATVLPALPPATLAQLGNAADGLLVAAPFRPTTAGGEGIEQYLKDMKDYAPDAKLNGFSKQGWLSVQAFYCAMSRHQDANISAAKVLSVFSQIEGLALGGVISPLTTTAGPAAPFNRLFNSKVLYGEVRDGKVVLLDENWQSVQLN